MDLKEKTQTWTIGKNTWVLGEDGMAHCVAESEFDRELTLDLDPRIDLTAPIYEQVQRLATKDRAAEARAERRRQTPHD